MSLAGSSLRPSPTELEFQSLILQQVSDAVISISNDGIVTYLNPSAERQYQTTAEGAVGRPLSDLYTYRWINQEDEAAALAALDRDGYWRGENLHVRHDGRVLQVESSVSVLHNASAAAVGLLAVIRDVTAARRVEEELRERELRFRRALSIETVGVLFFAIDGRITDASPSFERMSGYSRDELRTMEWPALTAPEFLAITRQSAENLARHGETAPYEKQMVRKDGSRWWGLFAPKLMAAPAAGEECVEFIVDVTGAKRAEAALRESEQRQRMALDAAALGTWRHRIEDGVIDLDARARSHYGIDAASVEIPDVLARIHPDDVAMLQQSIAAALDPVRRAPVQAEYRVIHRDDRVCWLSINGVVQFDASGRTPRPTVGIGTTRDITAQKHAEEALREADRRKDEFLAILAHELRNPLAPIRTAVGILRMPRVPEPLATRSRQVIERQVAHMTRLIDDLLDVSRLARGKMNLQRGPLLLDQVLDAAIETAKPWIEERRHTFEQRRLPSVVCLEGDLARLSQVFANLLNNAAKFTPVGGVIQLLVAERRGSVDVSVTDSGFGIDPEHLEAIFELFTQNTNPAAPATGGLGIGLALARRLVQLHGGSLTASSAGPGLGATFTVTLPASPSPEAGCTDLDPEQPRTRDLGRRVLVVDDNVDAAETTAALLSSAGCLVSVVFGGEEALAEVSTFQPEIVLLDLGMPGLSGVETCARMRQGPAGAALFIAAITGWGQDSDRRRTQDAGFDAHLVKPVAPEALLTLIEHARKESSA